MPTLKEFRAILRKGLGSTKVRDLTVDDPTSHLELELRTGLDVDKMSGRKAPPPPPKYRADAGGKDAVIEFGMHASMTLTAIFDKDPSYMAFLIETFSKHKDKVSADFVDIVKYVVKSKS